MQKLGIMGLSLNMLLVMKGYKMFTNIYSLKRGTICVARRFDGKMIALKIEKQGHYKEYNGCFSII